MGGSAGDTFTPGTPTPGATCADAGELPIGGSVLGTIASGEEQWWMFTVGVGDWSLQISDATAFVITVVYTGDCSALSTVNTLFNNGCVGGTVSEETVFHAQIVGFGDTGYTIKADNAACP